MTGSKWKCTTLSKIQVMQIQSNERDKIAIWFGNGIGVREIGRLLLLLPCWDTTRVEKWGMKLSCFGVNHHFGGHAIFYSGVLC